MGCTNFKHNPFGCIPPYPKVKEVEEVNRLALPTVAEMWNDERFWGKRISEQEKFIVDTICNITMPRWRKMQVISAAMEIKRLCLQRGLDAIASKTPTPENIEFAKKIKARQVLPDIYQVIAYRQTLDGDGTFEPYTVIYFRHGDSMTIDCPYDVFNKFFIKVRANENAPLESIK